MKKVKKLELNKETVRELNKQELEKVEGAGLCSLAITVCGRRCYQSAYPNMPC